MKKNKKKKKEERNRTKIQCPHRLCRAAIKNAKLSIIVSIAEKMCAVGWVCGEGQRDRQTDGHG